MNLREIIQKASWINCTHHVGTYPERVALGTSELHGIMVEVCVGCLTAALQEAYREYNDKDHN